MTPVLRLKGKLLSEMFLAVYITGLLEMFCLVEQNGILALGR